MLRGIKTLFRKYDLIIVFIFSFLLSAALYFYPPTHEFGVNFLTEIMGVWIAVLLVNRILEKKERQKRVSIDQRILRETLSIIASYFSIWKHLSWKYFPDAKIKNEKDLIAIYPKIISATNLSDSFDIVSIHAPESWKLFFHHRTIKQCFENYHNTLSDDIKSLIDNFKIHLDPQLLGCLLEIMESKYLHEINSIFQNEETDFVISDFGQDTNKLESYLSKDVNHVNKITELIKYCWQLSAQISEFTDVNQDHYDIKRYFINPVVAHAKVIQKVEL